MLLFVITAAVRPDHKVMKEPELRDEHADPWKVILAAGAGRRLQTVTGGVPKQFWRCGDASLLDQTIDRFEPIAPRSRTVIIVDERHREHVVPARRRNPMANVVVQPEDRGTAAGVLLAITPVLEREPDAIVILTPADHGVRDAAGFRMRTAEAVGRVRESDDLVLFGVSPVTARDDYGWISLEEGLNAAGGFQRVAAFVEKPDAATASGLLRAGAVWNTMVLVARATRIRDLFASLLPDLTNQITAVSAQPEERRSAYLTSIYSSLPRHDFSRDVIARASGLTACVLPASLGWTDLGTPERLREWQRLNMPPLAEPRWIHRAEFIERSVGDGALSSSL